MENQESKSSALKRILQASAIVLIIFVLPLGSVFYSKTGLDYYKKATSELKNYGTIPAFALTNIDGQIVKQDLVDGKLVIVSYLSDDPKEMKERLEVLSKMHQQFDDHNDVIFLIHAFNNQSTLAKEWSSLASEYGLRDREQCFFLTGSESEVSNLLGRAYKIPEFTSDKETSSLSLKTMDINEIGDYPYMVLADTSATIRNYYDSRELSSVKRMVEHIIYLLPQISPEEQNEKKG